MAVPQDRAAEGKHPGAWRLRGGDRANTHRALVRRQAEDAEQRLHQCLDQRPEGLADGRLAVHTAVRLEAVRAIFSLQKGCERMRFRFRKIALSPFVVLVLAGTAAAQTWPTKPIRFIV